MKLVLLSFLILNILVSPIAAVSENAAGNKAKNKLIDKGGVHAVRSNQNEKFTASSVDLPGDMHVGGKTSSDLLDIEMGDLVITPLPSRTRQ